MNPNKFRVTLSKMKNMHQTRQDNQPSSNINSSIQAMVNVMRQLIQKQFPQTIDSHNLQNKQKIYSNQRQTNERKSYSDKINGENICLESRDRYVQLQLPKLINKTYEVDFQDKNQKIIKRWFAQVCKASISTTFNYYFQDKMTYEQAKLFCSECILRNLIRLHKHHSLSPQEMRIINEDLKQNISVYMGQRYPMTGQKQVNKHLKDAIKKVDNIENLDNDLIIKSKIGFEKRQNGDYNDLIMQILNYVLDATNKTVTYGGFNSTNYLAFQNQMISIFQSIYKDEGQQIIQPKIKQTQNGQNFQKEDNINNSNQQSNEQQNHFQKQKSKLKRQKDNEQIKQYTNYVIGRKIPQSIQSFTEAQIRSNHLIIKSPSVLRLLTKWCEQLANKFYTQNYFMNRNQPYRAGDDVKIIPDLKTKQILDKYARQQKVIIQQEMQKVFSNNYQMQSKLLKRETENIFTTYLSQLEESYGKFTNKQIQNLHSYIIIYLNKLIHGLLTVSQKAFQQQKDRQYNTNQIWRDQAPLLLSFTIGDLMRCRFTSKQKEVLKVLQTIQTRSYQAEKGQKQFQIKIVRIKNRLSMGTNDVLININFNKQILCEVQIAIQSKQSKFSQYSNKFNHYIYQIQRSIMGPITQLCSICHSLDSRVGTFKNIKQKFKKQTHQKIIDLKPLSLSFICSQCSMVYSHNNYIKSHLKSLQTSETSYTRCARCSLNQESDEQILQLMVKDNLKLQQQRKFLKGKWKRVKQQTCQIPMFGICCKIQSKFINLTFFQKIKSRGQIYLFGKRPQQRTFLLTKLNSQKEIHKFMNDHLIFQVEQEILNQKFQKMDQVSARNQFIIPQDLLEFQKKQKQIVSLNEDSLQEFPKGIVNLLKLKTLKISGSDNKFEQVPAEFFNLPNLNSVNFSSIKIDRLTIMQQTSSQLQELILFQTGLQTLPLNLGCLSKLKRIDIQATNVEFLPDTIGQLKNLKYLFVSNTKISKLPQTIGNLCSLNRFSAYETPLKQLPLSFSRLQNIQMLELNNTQIETFPQQISSLKKLKQLYLHYTKISKLPSSIKSLTDLQVLSISDAEITQFCEQITCLTKLKRLYLDNNKIQTIPKSIQNLQNLQSLHLDSTNITQLPNQFQHLKNLTRLYLEQTPLKIIPNAIKNCQNLAKLSLDEAQLTQFPQQFCNMENLTGLYLSKNKIISLSNQIKNLKKLQDLYLNQTLLKELPLNIGTSILQLQLNKTLITQFPICIQFLPQIKDLFLQETQISLIPEWIGVANTKLVNLKLSGTLIKQLPQSFSNLIYLTQLNLSNTLIEIFPSPLKKLTRLRKLNVSKTKIDLIPKFVQSLINIQNQGFILIGQGQSVQSTLIKKIECQSFVMQKGDQLTRSVIKSILIKYLVQ